MCNRFLRSFTLLRLVQNTHVSQKRYADDGSAAGRLEDLLLFFKELTEYVSCFGYSVNLPMSQLIVKEAIKFKALSLFEGTAVGIVNGCRILGSIIANEKVYESIFVTTTGKFSNLLIKIGAGSENIP